MSNQEVSYRSFIHKIQKASNPEIGRNNAASVTLNNLVVALVNRFAEVMHTLANESNPNKVVSTIGNRVVTAAAKIILPGELAEFSLQAAKDATLSFTRSKKVASDNKIGAAERAGLILPPTRVKNQLRNFFNKRPIAGTVDIALAAILEFVISEVINAASELAKVDKKKRITPFNITSAINKDKELKEVFKHFLVSGGVTSFDYNAFKGDAMLPEEAEEEDEDEFLADKDEE